MFTRLLLIASGIGISGSVLADTATVFLVDRATKVAQAQAAEATGHLVFNPHAGCEVTLDLYGVQQFAHGRGRQLQLACSSVCGATMQIGENTFVTLTKAGRFSYECGEHLRVVGQVH